LVHDTKPGKNAPKWIQSVAKSRKISQIRIKYSKRP
jgi:hypothetical protein